MEIGGGYALRPLMTASQNERVGIARCGEDARNGNAHLKVNDLRGEAREPFSPFHEGGNIERIELSAVRILHWESGSLGLGLWSLGNLECGSMGVREWQSATLAPWAGGIRLGPPRAVTARRGGCHRSRAVSRVSFWIELRRE